jgi:16S rRNA (adenine1518-N6/adenine1519-N6)-dimethyltransferase
MLSKTRKILKKHGIKLDRRKGQNYLIDKGVLSRIISSAEISREDVVLEIGAGIGTLTIPLAERANHVFAVEKDVKIAEVLEERLEDLKIFNVEVLIEDATRMEFPEFNKVVSNLPYKISSPITFRLLENDFDFGVLMYQKEFAERMVAEPGSRNYSRLSVMMHLCADVEFLFNVPKESFFPQPKVSSAVIKLRPNAASVDPFFMKTSRALFQHKRKTVKNSLLDSFHELADLDKKSAKTVVSKLNPDLLVRRVVSLEPGEVMEISNDLRSVLKEFN